MSLPDPGRQRVAKNRRWIATEELRFEWARSSLILAIFLLSFHLEPGANCTPFELVRHIFKPATIPTPDPNGRISDIYFKRFGYSTVDKLTTAESTRALHEFCKFAGLPISQDAAMSREIVQKMKQPRCGNPEILREFRKSSGLPSWSKQKLTYKIARYPTGFLSTKQHEIDIIFDVAFKKWTRATNISFIQIHQGGVDIEIKFDRREHDCPFGDLNPQQLHLPVDLGHSFGPVSKGNRPSKIHGDIHLNDFTHWSLTLDGERNSIYLPATVMHMIGHSLGLNHSSRGDSIMRPFESRQEELSLEDATEIHTIYQQSIDLNFCEIHERKLEERYPGSVVLNILNMDDCKQWTIKWDYKLSVWNHKERKCYAYETKRNSSYTIFAPPELAVNQFELPNDYVDASELEVHAKNWSYSDDCDLIVRLTGSGRKRIFECHKFQFDDCCTILIRKDRTTEFVPLFGAHKPVTPTTIPSSSIKPESSTQEEL